MEIYYLLKNKDEDTIRILKSYLNMNQLSGIHHIRRIAIILFTGKYSHKNFFYYT